MTERMYPERKGNIAAFRGCNFFCTYCNFRNSLKRSSCPNCQAFIPHAHLEVLSKNPPRTAEGEFITMALNSDIAFASLYEMRRMIEYCRKWHDRTFLIQSKNPYVFDYWSHYLNETNIIIDSTIETNKYQITPNTSYSQISSAPMPGLRLYILSKISLRKVMTIEPILDFESERFIHKIKEANPEWVWIGYDSKPDKHRLPEPPLQKTIDFIQQLEAEGIKVKQKLIRKAWWE